MARSEKLTIRLPSEVVKEVREAVRKRGGTVSGYVANAVVKYEKREGLRALLDELDAEYGLPSAEDRRWAEKVLSGDPSVRHEPVGSARPRGRRKSG